MARRGRGGTGRRGGGQAAPWKADALRGWKAARACRLQSGGFFQSPDVRAGADPLPRSAAQRLLHLFGAAKQPADEPADFWAAPFWRGDTIGPEPLTEFHLPPDDQAVAILEGRPESIFIVRFSTREPASWRRLHPDACVVTDSGETLPHVSLASDRFWEDCGRRVAESTREIRFEMTGPETRVFRLTPDKKARAEARGLRE